MIVIDVPNILYSSYVTLFIHRYPCPSSIVRENSQNKKEGKDQELIQSSTTPDPVASSIMRVLAERSLIGTYLYSQCVKPDTSITSARERSHY